MTRVEDVHHNYWQATYSKESSDSLQGACSSAPGGDRDWTRATYPQRVDAFATDALDIDVQRLVARVDFTTEARSDIDIADAHTTRQYLRALNRIKQITIQADDGVAGLTPIFRYDLGYVYGFSQTANDGRLCQHSWLNTLTATPLRDPSGYAAPTRTSTFGYAKHGQDDSFFAAQYLISIANGRGGELFLTRDFVDLGEHKRYALSGSRVDAGRNNYGWMTYESYTTSTSYDLALGVALTTTDANSVTNEYEYDGYGRLRKAWVEPQDKTQTPTTPTRRLSYYEGPTATTGALCANAWCTLSEQVDQVGADGYLKSWTFFDGLGRAIETQGESDAAGNPAILSDLSCQRPDGHCQPALPGCNRAGQFPERRLQPAATRVRL